VPKNVQTVYLLSKTPSTGVLTLKKIYKYSTPRSYFTVTSFPRRKIPPEIIWFFFPPFYVSLTDNSPQCSDEYVG
jgi:hypothetical protein